jgi:hypothetical protein
MDYKLPNNMIIAEEVDNKSAEHAACEVEETPDPQLVETPSVPV